MAAGEEMDLAKVEEIDPRNCSTKGAFRFGRLFQCAAQKHLILIQYHLMILSAKMKNIKNQSDPISFDVSLCKNEEHREHLTLIQ